MDKAQKDGSYVIEHIGGCFHSERMNRIAKIPENSL